VNGVLASNPGIVAPNDTINLLNTAGGLEAQFTVPSELDPRIGTQDLSVPISTASDTFRYLELKSDGT